MKNMVTLREQRLVAKVNRRIFSLLQEAMPSGSPNYVSAAGLMKPVLREVRDAIKPNGLGPEPVTIIGRASMVDQLGDLMTAPGTFDPEATAELRAKSRLGVYRGRI